MTLRQLFTSKSEDLMACQEYNVIYKIENIITNKVYIGQAKDFLRRFIGPGFNHKEDFINYCKEECTNRHLYSSIRKYGSKNFEVTILESNCQDLSDREIYWIEYYNSYYDGYNMNKGGDHTEQLHTKEVNRRRYNTCLEKYGCLPIHTSESQSRATEVRTELYGHPTGKLQSPEIVRARIQLISDPIEHARRKSIERLNHGGVLAFNTKESIEKSLNTRRIVYGPQGPFHQPGVQDRAAITKLFNTLSSMVPGLPKKDLDTFLHKNPKGSSKAHRVARNILSRIDHMRSDSRWTPEYESIFENNLLT